MGLLSSRSVSPTARSVSSQGGPNDYPPSLNKTSGGKCGKKPIMQKVKRMQTAHNNLVQTLEEIFAGHANCFESMEEERVIPTRYTQFAEEMAFEESRFK